MCQFYSSTFDQLSKLVLADLISTAQEIELFERASRTVQKYRLDTISNEFNGQIYERQDFTFFKVKISK